MLLSEFFFNVFASFRISVTSCSIFLTHTGLYYPQITMSGASSSAVLLFEKEYYIRGFSQYAKCTPKKPPQRHKRRFFNFYSINVPLDFRAILALTSIN